MEQWRPWYDALSKPSWTPPGVVISVIWSTLYPIIVVTYGIVFYKILKRQLPYRVAVPFVLNILTNLAFSPIFFGTKNLPLATADILVVWITIVWTIVVLWPKHKVLAALQLPYLTWISIASVLQVSILLWNR